MTALAQQPSMHVTTAKSSSIVSLPEHLSTLQADLTGLVFGLYERIVVAAKITTMCGIDLIDWVVIAKFLVTAHHRCSKGSLEQDQFIPSAIILGLWYWSITVVDLTHALMYSKWSCATDPRDKVFALLGLVGRRDW